MSTAPPTVRAPGYLGVILANRGFLAFGFALTLFSSFGQTFFISLFGAELRESFGLSHATFGLAYSTATLASGLVIIKVGRAIDHFDLRLVTAAVLGGLAIACAAMATAPVVAVLIAAIFLLRLTGQGMLGHTAMTAMARYFDAGRGKAMSLVALGYAAGEAVLPSIAVAAIAVLGWRGAWGAAAAIVGLLALPAALLMLRGHAARHEAHLAEIDAADRAEAAAVPVAGTTPRRHWTRGEVLRDRRFWMILPTVMTPGFIATGIFFHQTHLVETKGWTMPWFAACFAIFAGAQLPAGLVGGPLVDRFGARRLLPLFVIPLIVSLVVLAAGRPPAIAAAFMLLAGLTSGVASIVVGAAWAELYGTRHLGAIRALATAIMVFGTAGSPVLMGVAIDAGVSMEAIAIACAVGGTAATILAGVALRGGAAGGITPR